MSRPSKDGWYYVLVALNGEECIKRDYFDGQEWHYFGPEAVKEFYEKLPAKTVAKVKRKRMIKDPHVISKRAGALSSMSWLLMDAYNKLDEAEQMMDYTDNYHRYIKSLKRSLGTMIGKAKDESRLLVEELYK